MKLIHRHIFWSVALTCLAAVGLFAFVLMLGNVLKDLLGYLLAGQLDVGTVVKLIALLVPFVVSYALPMGILAGVLLVLGRMSSDREITAMRAAGVSVAGISAPIFFFALLGVAAALLVNFQFMPAARMAYQRELADAVRRDPLSLIVARTFIRDFPGLVIYVGEKKGETLEDIWVWELNAQGKAKTFVRARSGKMNFDEPANKLVLTIEHMQAMTFPPKDPEAMGEVSGVGGSDRATFDLTLDKMTGQKSIRKKPKWMTFDQLMAEWRRLGRPDPAAPHQVREKERMKIQIAIHEKCATAFAILSFALIAIPLGIKVSRKETSANLGVALALAMGYYFSTVIVGWFDNRPELRPDLLMWLPNLGFQALGIWMFRKVDRA